MPKTMLLSLFAALILFGHKGFADEPESNRHTVVGLLSLNKDEPAKLIINATHRARYTLHVQNKERVVKLMKRAEYLGLVRVEMELNAEPKIVHILKVEPVRVRRVPLYDSDLKAVAARI